MTTDDGGTFGSPHIIAFAPVRQSPSILKLFLKHLRDQPVDVWAYDDNTDPESSEILQGAGIKMLPQSSDLPASNYGRDEETHLWDASTVRRVAAIKNQAIDLFLESRADGLLLIDSDVLVPSGLVEHLASAQAPVIASVFWTRWRPEMPEMANVFGTITSHQFLRDPDHHHHLVPGLGACTLIRRGVFEAGVRFAEQAHLATEGEDRWFCYLAARRGIPLTACTHLTPFHVYRDSQLEEAQVWSDAHSRPPLLV